MAEKIENALYLVPTPIGNLNDLSKRAFQILTNVDIIACEDTRTSGILLKQFKITPKKLLSYHEHNEDSAALEIVESIKRSNSVALITDAGTPAISDPGYNVVRSAIKEKIKIIPLPGPTAMIPALAASGMPVHGFVFAGFPPQKKGRKAFLEKFLNYDLTTVFYESPHRLEKFLNEASEIAGGSRRICIAREISKKFEEFLRGSIQDIIDLIVKGKIIKGEIVIIVEPKQG